MTDERAVRDNADEIQDQGQIQGDQGQPEQEAADPPRETPSRGARPGDEGARLLRRVLQLEPAGVRRRPLELLVPYGGSGHRRHGAREGVPVRLAGRALPLAREPGAAAAVSVAGEIRQVRAVRRGDRFRLLALALVCAGAVGNVIDRIRSAQGVVDFVDVGIGGTRWPTFNVADSAITVGAIALAVSLWLEGRAQERAKEAGAAQH